MRVEEILHEMESLNGDDIVKRYLASVFKPFDVKYWSMENLPLNNWDRIKYVPSEEG